LYTVASGKRTSHDLHIVGAEVLYCCFQVVNLEGGMCPVALRYLIASVVPMYLSHATFFGLANEVNLKTVLIVSEPGAGNIGAIWTRKLMQPQYLNIEAA